jgi:hypothetical protein
VSDLLFQFFDCDNHYYEAMDAFTRHLAPGFAKRTMQWAQIDGKTRLLVGGKVNRFIPNPTVDPVARPGAMDEYFRGRNPKKAGTRELFGELEPIRAEYRDRDARLARMDEQGMAGAIFLPTLGSAWSRRWYTTCPRCARRSGPSTGGWRRTGVSRTGGGFSPRRTSRSPTWTTRCASWSSPSRTTPGSW